HRAPATDGADLQDGALADKHRIIAVFEAYLGAREIGAREIGAREIGVREIGAREIGAREIGVREIGAREIGAREIGAREIGAREIGARFHAPLDRQSKFDADRRIFIRFDFGYKLHFAGPTVSDFEFHGASSTSRPGAYRSV